MSDDHIKSEKNIKTNNLETGVQIIQRAVEDLPTTPGVYRMLDAQGGALYVGKAKALKKRVISYTHIDKLPERLKRMVALTRSMEFVHTHTEAEALLLESNLIKKLKPTYNILLRDDKSFPYILMTEGHDFPLILKHRGAKKTKGQYYGPFAGAGDVNRALATLQRVFMLRNCSDNMFASRKRPCLQYQIKRCTAPCVGLVSAKEYAQQIKEARDFLEGKSRIVQEQLAKSMQNASKDEAYEQAALYRDRIAALAAIAAHQDINVKGLKNTDVIALSQDAKSGNAQCCIQVFFFRNDQNYGNKPYFPRHDRHDLPEAIMTAFIAQFYENKPVATEIITSHTPEEHNILEEALSSKLSQQVKIIQPQRGGRRRVLDFALKNADKALQRYHAQRAAEARHLEAVASLFNLKDTPQRIEIYDNSHISGTNMVGAMVVAGREGFNKKSYRKFNIKQARASDDYGMMREVMMRRFKGGLPEAHERPDLLLIDGGAGQLSAVKEALEECGVWSDLNVVAIAKGPERNAGREQFFIDGRAPFQCPEHDPTLHYLQRLRDEAHRFAITTHRARRAKQMTKSPLDGISGIGAKRKKALLHAFGSGKAAAEAGIEDLERVEGISQALAQKIYDHFH